VLLRGDLKLLATTVYIIYLVNIGSKEQTHI